MDPADGFTRWDVVGSVVLGAIGLGMLFVGLLAWARERRGP